MAKVEFPVIARNGGLKIVDREIFVRFLESKEGVNFTLSLKEEKGIRSLGWNNYYWTVVIPAVRAGLIDVGYDPDQLDSEIVHDFLKSRFLKSEIYSKDKEELINVCRSTTRLDNKEFAAYVAQVQKWASEFLGIYIPDPNEGMGLGMKQTKNHENKIT